MECKGQEEVGWLTDPDSAGPTSDAALALWGWCKLICCEARFKRSEAIEEVCSEEDSEKMVTRGW